ncbi:hypothetical protein [Streptomyces sp. NPDC048603]|uniref:hypothetical protein n=1 Tax=Streptomyces sp. NPDC048603 TaxID=3365577 RepID=UPI00372110A7
MTPEPDYPTPGNQKRPLPPPPNYPPATAFTAGDGAMMAGRDVRDTVTGPSIGGDNWGTVAGRDIDNSRRTTKIGGAWGVAIAILLLAGTGGGVYWATQGDSVSGIGARPGEDGVRDTWVATSEAVRKGDGETVCALMTPDYRARLEKEVPDTCAKAVGELFASSESASLDEAASGNLQKVSVQGEWAEVVEVWPDAPEPSYRYMERFGDRWRWTHRVLYAEFHPETCTESGRTGIGTADPRCRQDSLFPPESSG